MTHGADKPGTGRQGEVPLAERPLLTACQPDNAVPEFRFGMLRAVNFWRELDGSTEAKVWRYIERHEPGRIRPVSSWSPYPTRRASAHCAARGKAAY